MPENYFVTYQSFEEPDETPVYTSPLLDDAINIDDWALGYSPSGDIVLNESPAAKELKSRMNLNYENVDSQTYDTTSSVSQGVTGDKKKAVNFFINKGLSPHAAAGIIGNLMGESSLNTGAIGDNNTSIGIAQWHNERGNNLKNFAKQRGTDWKDYDTQLEFLWHELNTDYKGVLESLKSSTNVDQATDIFLERFERPKNPNQSRQKRRNYARSLLS